MQHKPSNWFYLLLPLLYIGSTVQAATSANSQVAGTLYKEECASCHMAYPAELLPARSWQKLLGKLDQHFGDNATLDPASLQTLSQYLQDHSADTSGSKRARKILRSVPDNSTPLRISDLPYIRNKHDEIPARYIKSNPQVKSLSNCAACHQSAEQGSFSEHQVRIPGYGQWDD